MTNRAAMVFRARGLPANPIVAEVMRMLFDKIITLSLNPVADITLYVDRYEMGGENTVTSELYDAAGKAVDVSRVLRAMRLRIRL